MWSSSKYLSVMITSGVHIEKASVIVELGAGTGAVTPAIMRKIPKTAHFFALEINHEIYEVFKKNFPEVKAYNESAANLKQILKDEGLPSIDLVISGLPWASFPEKLQDEILDIIHETLTPGGYFTTFAYIQGMLMPGAKYFRKRIHERFSEVKKSPLEWRNFPPAFVYRCRK